MEENAKENGGVSGTLRKSGRSMVKMGKCPKCDRIIVRFSEVDVGVCTCKSAVEVPLTVAVDYSAYKLALKYAKKSKTGDKGRRQVFLGQLFEMYSMEQTSRSS